MPSFSIWEILFLLCFAVSWPISIVRSLRTKVVIGKSPNLHVAHYSGLHFRHYPQAVVLQRHCHLAVCVQCHTGRHGPDFVLRLYQEKSRGDEAVDSNQFH